MLMMTSSVSPFLNLSRAQSRPHCDGQLCSLNLSPPWLPLQPAHKCSVAFAFQSSYPLPSPNCALSIGRFSDEKNFCVESCNLYNEKQLISLATRYAKI